MHAMDGGSGGGGPLGYRGISVVGCQLVNGFYLGCWALSAVGDVGAMSIPCPQVQVE